MSYLNVLPLVWPLMPAQERGGRGGGGAAASESGGEDGGLRATLAYAVPAQLAPRLRAGEFEAAIVPVAEYLHHPQRYNLVRGAAIGARGDVLSVAIFSHRPLEELSHVVLDPASLTSNLLARVLLRELGPHAPRVVAATQAGELLERAPADWPEDWGRIIIGDPALRALPHWSHRRDLAGWWHQSTGGMPFVFAAWLVPEHAWGEAPALAALLQAAAEGGQRAVPEIIEHATAEMHLPRELLARYLTAHLKYEFGPAEHAALELFAARAAEAGLLPTAPRCRFV